MSNNVAGTVTTSPMYDEGIELLNMLADEYTVELDTVHQDRGMTFVIKDE